MTSPMPNAAAAARARAARTPSSAATASAAAAATSFASVATAASASSVAAAVASLPGHPLAFRLRLERVKCGSDAGVALASERVVAPTAAAHMAQRSAALLLPPSLLHATGRHAGESAWVCDESARWFVRVRVWPGDKVQRAGCRLLLPSHATTPLEDGCTAQLHPLHQAVERAARLRLRPLDRVTRDDPAMQQAMSSALRALLADRCVYVGEEVCVTQMNETYAFTVAGVDEEGADGDGGAMEREEKKRAHESSDVSAVMQRLAIDPSSSGAAAAAAPSPVFPRLFAVHSTTRVSLASASDDPSSTSASSERSVGLVSGSISDDIGGLEAEIGALRQLLEWTPEKAAAFAHYNIKPPKGILLYGPPGTGKTMIARAVAAQTSSSFYLINGPEIISKYVGESEEKLAAVFAHARKNAPAIIFIDEIDSLCPKRDESTDEMQKRIVASLLTLMDGVTGSNSAGGGGAGGAGSSSSSVDDRVMVIGATNRPDSIDTAMRRAGRFDREVEIGIPNETKRLDILKKMIRNMPHALSDKELVYVASVTHGYVGADLKAVCREAALAALARQQQSHPDEWMERLQSASDLASLQLHPCDFEAALTSVKPSAMRSLVIDVPKVAWTDIGGQEDVKQKLKEAVDWPLMHPEAFLRLGIQPPKGILLYGPPGCSKTLMAKALASESSRNFIAVKGPELFSKWVGESEKAVKEIFRKARAAAPSIVFFDEIDSIAASRGEGGGGEGGERVAHRVLSQLLTELDGIEPLKQVTILAATNRPDIIDAALLRPGRIDRILYVSPPDEASCQAILRIEFRRIGAAAAQLDPAALASRCVGLSGAEISALCREAALVAMEEDMHAQHLTGAHFDAAFTRITPRITPAMLQFYHNYAAKSTVASV